MEDILKEITTYCGNECCSVNSCPEEVCVLYRIEKNAIKINDLLEKAVKYSESLIEKYDGNQDITDLDICHIIEILKGRE